MSGMRASHLGVLVGLGFGLAVLYYGFVKGVFLVACCIVGWLVGRVIDGEVDISRFVRPRDGGDLE